jgi:hypothetical protein
LTASPRAKWTSDLACETTGAASTKARCVRRALALSPCAASTADLSCESTGIVLRKRSCVCGQENEVAAAARIAKGIQTIKRATRHDDDDDEDHEQGALGRAKTKSDDATCVARAPSSSP